VPKSSRIVALSGAVLLTLTSVVGVSASSHREAPLIAQDPTVDNTDLYAWVDGTSPSKVNIVLNYTPQADAAGGPNFWQFDPAARYAVHIDNDRDGHRDVSYYFTFKTTRKNPGSFLYNNGPVTSRTDTNLNIRQTYTIQRFENGVMKTLASGVPTVPINVGRRTNPPGTYAKMVSDGVKTINAAKFWAGQTDDPFFVDLGSIFDLAGLRPFNSLHVIPLANAAGVDALKSNNVLSIALQVPITSLTSDHKTHAAGDAKATVGIWAVAQRRKTTTINADGSKTGSGPWVQVSRLGNPLINEAIIPVGLKDQWNRRDPYRDKDFEKYYLNPELAAVANAVYPALDDADTTGRTDLSLILLNGLPGLNSTGSVKADMLRLNTGVPPCTADPADDDIGACRRLGAFYDDAADLAAWPNGRRLTDDVTDIALRAVIQGYGDVLQGLFGVKDRTPNKLVGDGVDKNDLAFRGSFPYSGIPSNGYAHIHHN
jgi:Domain of unknown function (DUF4331)